MRLYAGISKDFIEITQKNQIAPLLREEFFNCMGYYPSQNEVMSWRNSLLNLSVLFENNGLTNHGIFLEYQLPQNSQRLDCIICGKDHRSKNNAVIIELKQWEKCKISDYNSNMVITWIGGGNREVLHPSVQVGHYKYYLENFNSAFYEDPENVLLSACCYLHNYNYYESDIIFGSRFKDYLDYFPIFTADDTEKLGNFLNFRVQNGDSGELLSRIENAKLKPSKKLMKEFQNTIKKRLIQKDVAILGKAEDFILLDDQIVAYDSVLSIVKNGFHDKQKYAIIIKGGPGTGKSVIALKLLADLNGLERNVQYAIGSKSFRDTLRRIIGYRYKDFFQYFMSYGNCESNSFDVLIMDEAHRIRERTVVPYLPSTGKLQVEELIKSAKVSVFFIDDKQIVRPKEIGSVDFIKEHAKKFKCKIYEFELLSQFRCGGSDGFLGWIDNTLHIQRTANTIWSNNDDYEFKIFQDPFSLEEAIKQKIDEGYVAKMAAGFCWPWSKELNPDGSLRDDVIIGDFKRPWNARYDAVGLRADIPKAAYWAYDPRGIHQIGCVYTAMGFEFDYIGVIFGNDLMYDFSSGKWKGYPKNSHDSEINRSGEKFTKLVKNIYRILLTRGQKGCYLYFMDKDTENFFRSRIE